MKDNQIIAEFMGYTEKNKKIKEIYNQEAEVKSFSYHTSWDWLMPVMAKLVENFGSGWKFEQGYNLNVRYKEVVKFIKQENEDKL